jgi:pimeloyl-ACP methyl ester carboxylesterase
VPGLPDLPVGYGYSERVPGYAGEALADQALAVLDRHGVDRFVIWGYSKGGAMAACIARGTGRTAGLVCGAFSLLDRPSDASMRQMDRRLAPDHPSRSLWAWVKRFDWAEQLATTSRRGPSVSRNCLWVTPSAPGWGRAL